MTHGSNLAYCLVLGDYIWLKCHSEKCRGSRGVCLGKAPPSLLDWLHEAPDHEAPGHEAPDSKRQKTPDASGHIDLNAAVGGSTAAMADVSNHMDLDAVMRESTAVMESMVVRESTAASSDVGRGMVEYEEALSTSTECPSYVETKVVRDTFEHKETTDHRTAGNNNTAMPDSPTSAFPWHNLTNNDLIQLLDILPSVSSPD